MCMRAVMALVKLLLANVISTRFSCFGSKQFMSANLLSEPLYQSTPLLKRGVWIYNIFQKDVSYKIFPHKGSVTK